MYKTTRHYSGQLVENISVKRGMQRVGGYSAKERDRLDITRYSLSWFFRLRCMYFFKCLSQEVAEKPWLSFLHFSGEAFLFRGVSGIWGMTVLRKAFNILGLCSSDVSNVASPPTPIIEPPKRLCMIPDTSQRRIVVPP